MPRRSFCAIALTIAAGALSAPAAAAAAPSWLAGDLHVHTCFSHDVYCGPADDNTGPADFYTFGSPVGDRFREAAARGLDFLAITDHNDVRSLTDPGRGAAGVVPVGGYEASLRGHAQALGARRVYDPGDRGAGAIRSLAASLRADGGAFQINHPGNQLERQFNGCGDTGVLDWQYGYEVQPDTIEVFNNGTPVPPAERYLECWLDRGAHVAVTGGSDSHWLTLALLGAGIGRPTTWVLGDTRTEAGVLAALKAGRTAVSREPPALGGAPLLLGADAGGDGRFETVQGGTAAPGSRLRVRSASPAARGYLRVRANGRMIVQRELVPGGSVEFEAPASEGWARATLHSVPDPPMSGECNTSASPVSTCTYDGKLLALTSPLYLARARVRFSFGRRQRAATLRRRHGVRIAVTCSAACEVTAFGRVGGRRAGIRRISLGGAGRRTLTLRLDRRALRSLRRGARIGLRLAVKGGRTARSVVEVAG